MSCLDSGMERAMKHEMRQSSNWILGMAILFSACGAEQAQTEWQVPEVGKHDGLSSTDRAQYWCETADGQWRVTADIPVAASYHGNVHLWQADYFGPGEWGLLPIGFFDEVKKSTVGSINEHKIDLELFDYEEPGTLTLSLEASNAPEVQLVGSAVLHVEENPSVAGTDAPTVIEFSSCRYLEKQ